MESEWSSEVLFPAANAVGYRLIYEAETWLRRICWTALLLREGPAWATAIDAPLRKALEKQSKINGARWYLGVDAEEELLWSTTQGQLAGLISLGSIADTVRDLCGVGPDVLSIRLKSISQIRNTLAHNRAISDETLTILEGDLSVIRTAARRFKSHTMYSDSDIFTSGSPEDVPSDLLDFYYKFSDLEVDFWRDHGQQVYAAADRDFIQLVRLPVPPFEQWADGSKLQKALGLVAHLIVCVLANKDNAELTIVMPRNLADDEKTAVLTRFMTIGVLRDAWSYTPPEHQNTASSCWPRLWFYENRIPE